MKGDMRPGDSRRATGILLHTLGPEPSAEGVVAVLQDAQEDGRAVHLVLAMAQVVGHAAPFLRTPEGHAWLRTTLDKAAAAEAADLTARDDRDDDQAEDEA